MENIIENSKVKNTSKRLFEALEEHIEQPLYPLHMPGHKRRFWEFNFEDFDFTEINGLDNLQNPEECIDITLKAISEVFKSNESLILINGSTVGILASIMGTVGENDCIILARNCHQSAINAVYMAKCDYEFINPILSKSGLVIGIDIFELEKTIKRCISTKQNVKSIIITSPTYEGIVMDICKIVEVCNKYGVILIVDEAHGAYFIDEHLPISAIELGADVVIQSLHKTLPSPTQTALLHFGYNFKDEKYKKNIKKYLNMLQTTSPSYFFMYTIDKLVESIENGNLKPLFRNHYNRVIDFRNNFINIEKHGVFELIGNDVSEKVKVENYNAFDYDMYKLTFLIKKGTGNEVAEILRKKFKIEVEMSQKFHIVCMTSIADNNEIFELLFYGLEKISMEFQHKEINNFRTIKQNEYREKIKICNIDEENIKLVNIKDSVNKICGKNITPYPPCIPFIIAGEIIQESDIKTIDDMVKNGISVMGSKIVENKIFIYIFEK